MVTYKTNYNIHRGFGQRDLSTHATRVPASVLVNVWSLVPHSCAHAQIVMVDTAYERGAHALSGKLGISMSAYQEAEILHLEIFATRQIRASVLATHEFPCLSCRRLALVNNQMVVDTANGRSGRHLSFAVSMTI